MSWKQRFLHHPRMIRLLHWEYWSMPYVYFPAYFHFAWLCLRSGCRYFFSATDPLIRNGGFLMESKKDIYDSLPRGYYPRTLFFPAGSSAKTVMDTVRAESFQFPLIVKPDIGMRGLAVKKTETPEELQKIIPVFAIDFLVQEFVPFEKEAGIFYCRYPDRTEGWISGIVTKEFLEVRGDGRRSLEELLRSDKRFILQLPSLRREYRGRMGEIPAAGETVQLVPYGNHARGAKFIDDSKRIDESLTRVMNDFCLQVPEFYYGRLDIRFTSWDDIKAGRNFSVIELNGAGSEPTHMYDPRHSLFFAWKEIMRHYRIMFRIARQNKKRGFPYMSLKEGSAMFRSSRDYSNRLQLVHEALLDN